MAAAPTNIQLYVMPYVNLARLYQQYELKPFKAVPLIKSEIPQHVVLDTRTLYQKILGVTTNLPRFTRANKLSAWNRVFKINGKEFRDHLVGSRPPELRPRFHGMVRTNGVAVSVLLGQVPESGRRPEVAVTTNRPSDIVYFQDAIDEITDDFVCIDPNKGDLLYCLGPNGVKLRYTQNQRRFECGWKRFRDMREKVTTREGMRVNQMDVRVPSTVCRLEPFIVHLREFFAVQGPRNFRARELIYHRRCWRQWRLNAYINKQRSESKFISKFLATFGNVPVIIGDWSQGHRPLAGQVATKNKSWHTSFRRAGIRTYALNEYLTSSICPHCWNRVSTFKQRPNPRPFANNMWTVHGLLRCTSRACRQEIRRIARERHGPNINLARYRYRLWNRDDVATKCHRYIVHYEKEFGHRPPLFQPQHH
jgi:hypothetical protein